MRSKNVLLAALVLLVLALVGGGGYVLLRQLPDDGGAGDGVRPAGGEPGATDGNAADGADAPNVARSGAGAAPKPPGRREGPVAKAPAAGVPWLSIPPYEDVLAAVDWEAVGRTHAQLIPLLNDRANSAYRGDVGALAGNDREEALWMDLIHIEEPHRPIFGDLREFRFFLQPAVIANSVAATLHARRRGLTEEQLEVLRQVAARGTAEEVRLREARDADEAQGKPDTLMAVEKDAQLARRRREYLREIEGILDEPQRELLHSDIARDRRRLDLFSAANVWMAPIRPLQYENPEDLPAQIKGMVMPSTHFKARQMVSDAVDRVFARFPPGRFEPRHRKIDFFGYVKLDDILDGCQLTADVIRGYSAAVQDFQKFDAPPHTIDLPMVPLRDPGE